MKNFAIAMFALLICAVTLQSVLALEVTVKDISMSYAPISVKIGETVPVNAYFELTSNASDVVVEVELSYEHGKEVSAKSDPLDVMAGVMTTESLSIKIPSDIEATSPGESYTLYVRVKDIKGTTIDTAEFPITVQRKNDLLDIQKVIKTTAEAGKSTLLTIVVKNTGSDEQEDVYVKVSVPELGIAAEERIGDLVAVDDNDKDDTATVDVPLKLPSNAADGVYSVIITAYNDDVETSKTESLKVKGVIGTKMDASEVVPQVLSQEITQGKSANYGLIIGNLADIAQTYSVEITGTDGWATYAITPLKVTLDAKDSETVNVMLVADQNAMSGQHTFVATVKSDNQIVKQLTLTANVKSAKTIDAMLVSVIVLAVILLILIIILVKSRKAESTETEESYY